VNIIENKKNDSSIFEESFFKLCGTYVHPTSIVGPNVFLEDNVKIGPFCVLQGKITIKSGTKIYSGVSIGSPAQNLDTKESLGQIEIGNNCQIREFVTIGASKYVDGSTKIGNNCYIMSYSHIAHDVILEDNVVLINSVNLGGHVHVEKNAFLMANCAAHQFCRIGQFVALTPYSAIRQDLPPFCMFAGLPAQYTGLNIVALKRAGLSSQNINAIKHVAKLFYQDKFLIKQIKEIMQNESEQYWTTDPYVKIFIDFIENSSRGVSKKSEI